MKKIIAILMISTCSLKLYSQNNSHNREPTYYLDSVECSGFPLCDPWLIDNLQVGKKAGTNGQIFINTKKSHKFKWLSFSKIAANYPNYRTTLFMVNNELVENQKFSMIDSSYILKIEKIDTKDLFIVGKKIKKTLILNIVTNTKENIEKSKWIHIRGTNELTKNTN
jgi:hypothetical protein